MRSEAVRAWRAFYSKALDQYDLTPAEYRTLYVAQKGRCWICRKAKGIHPDDPRAGGSRRLAIDHDHATGRVRGLLCSGGDKTCNRIIGWLDGPALERAAQYRSGTRVPARVLNWVRLQEEAAPGQGVKLSQAELDNLATYYLWAREDEA